MTRVLITAAIMCAMASSPVNAKPMDGAGIVRCDRFLQDKQDRQQDRMLQSVQWINGFLSAYNAEFYIEYHKGFAFDQPDMESILIFADQYCSTHRADTVGAAAAELLGRLLPQKKSQKPLDKNVVWM